MASWTPWPFRPLTTFARGDLAEPKVALTFDDGPNPPATERVLDLLDRYGARATFFVIGRWAERHPDTVRRIHARGHLVGNHTYSHTRPDFERAEAVIAAITGQPSRFVRAPWVKTEWCARSTLARSARVRIVNFSVESYDWERPGPERIEANVLSGARNGAIVLFHDGCHLPGQRDRAEHLLGALPRILDALSRSYRLVRLDEMRLIPERTTALRALGVKWARRFGGARPGVALGPLPAKGR